MTAIKEDVFIVSAARTPIGNFQGCFNDTSAVELGTASVKEVLKRANVSPQDVNEVIIGQALPTGLGQNPARQTSISAGISLDAPAYLINMLCGSGLKTVQLGYNAIVAGDASIIVAGGQESMTQTPHCMNMRSGTKLGNGTLVDTLLKDGLTDVFHNIHMGETAEKLAAKYSISREAQDAFAAESQRRAKVAQENGYFVNEIVPVEATKGRSKVLVSEDEYPKPETNAESLAKLRPCFIKNGTVTPGNASGINDSAAAVLLMSGTEVKSRGAKPLARIVAFAQSGVEPDIMGYGPVPAVTHVLKKAGWSVDEVDLFELNEAFAAQAISVNQNLGLDVAKVNIHGGAIALGHPIGASGTRVLVTLLYALKRTGGKKGIASLCIGGGMGIAIALEMV